MIHIKKLGFVKIAMPLFVLLTLSACSMWQEGNRTEIEDPGDGITETDLDAFTIEKIEKYEGMEITDWIDEQTVVLAKENQELGKMSLLENAEFYPRSIYVYNLDTKEFKPIKAPKNMFLGGATLSPDKKHLLYYEYSIGDIAYYLMSLEDGEQSSVKGDNISSAYTAEWTDEQHVIGASYSGGAYIADTSGNLTTVAELQEEQLYTVHKMQGKIYYITADSPSSQVYVLDLMTKEKKKLQLENTEGIKLSPDGKQMLFTQATESTKRLIIADVDGNIQSTITEGSNVTGASWSPNQQMIAYQLETVDNGEDSSGLYLYDVTAGKSVQIIGNVENASISWSPSGKKISVTEMDERNYNSSIIYIK
jgi:TolB protein